MLKKIKCSLKRLRNEFPVWEIIIFVSVVSLALFFAKTCIIIGDFGEWFFYRLSDRRV